MKKNTEKENDDLDLPKSSTNMSDTDDVTKIYTVQHSVEEELKKKKEIKKRQKKNTGYKIGTAFLILILIVYIVVASVGLTMVSQMIETAPDLDLNDFVSEESSQIYDDSGALITEVGVYLRENITYDECPESLVDAFLSIEDSRFFTHFGFDIPRFTKAILENLKNRNFGQGGSTFTMQLVKNTYFSVDAGDNSTERKKSIEYKVQQIYLAIKLENEIDKKHIFQLFMNRLNFGGNIRGVQKASMYYFGKDCTELSLSESALLAGIINLPNGYNPYYHLDAATQRRNEVLNMMQYHGYITEEEKELAKSIKIEDQLVGENRLQSSDSKYQSYIDVALSEAQKITGKDPTITGMKIYTNLNQTIQTEIDAIQNSETDIQFPDELMQVAMVAMDNSTGAIVGLGGGRNYDGARLLNRATMNYKQPGSCIKPVVSYALAFEYLGYSLDEILMDKPITYPYESMVLVNSNGKYQGDIKIKDALAWSLNIPAILTLENVVDKIGKEKVAAYMQAIGFSRVTADNFHLSFAIGGTWFETTVVEIAGATAMLINGGVYNEPHTISKVVLSNGEEYYPENQNKKILSSGSAYLTCQLMENNVSGPYFNWMQILKRNYPVYAKTGTSDWGRDGVQYGIPVGAMKDKWMVSNTSKYTNVVWLGYDMAVSGKQTYFNDYKQNLNIQGKINKALLDIEEEVLGYEPEGVSKPSDLEEITYVYGTYPHVRADNAPAGSTITSTVSKAGLEAQPLVNAQEYREYIEEHSTEQFGISAHYDQYSNLTVSWSSNSYTCSDGQKNISLHDGKNDVEQWGNCLVDLSWLTGGGSGSYWATIYVDDNPVTNISSDNGYYSGWATDLWGTVKVCGGSSNTDETACVVATYEPTEEVDYNNGWWDENGQFHPNN